MSLMSLNMRAEELRVCEGQVMMSGLSCEHDVDVSGPPHCLPLHISGEFLTASLCTSLMSSSLPPSVHISVQFLVKAQNW